jgi:hypothetical protein
MGRHFDELIFEEGSLPRRIEVRCFYQSHLKKIYILPLVEDLFEHDFSQAKVGTLRIDRASEVARIWKGHLEGCSVKSIENLPRSWMLAGNHVSVVPSVDDMIGDRLREEF